MCIAALPARLQQGDVTWSKFYRTMYERAPDTMLCIKGAIHFKGQPLTFLSSAG